MTARYDVAVIGAGSNGLAAACVLARAGRKVVVLESSSAIGGQSRVEEFAPGFKTSLAAFDAGWVSPLVAKSTGVRMPAASRRPACASIPAGESRDEMLCVPADIGAARAAIARYSAHDAQKWGDFVAFLHSQASALEELYQMPAPRLDADTASEVFPMLAVAAKLRRRGGDRVIDFLRTLPLPVSDLLDEWFEFEPLKTAIAAGGLVGIRQGPRSGGTAYVLLHYLAGAGPQSARGRPCPADGPDSFIIALQQRLLSGGAAIRTSSPVARILVEDDHVTGVALASGEEVSCGAVISTADPVHTLHSLVDPVWLDPELRHAVGNIKLRGCTAFVSYAVAGLPPALAAQDENALAGTFTLSRTMVSMERAYDAVKYNRLGAEAHVEVAIPSRRWQTFAPAGCDVVVARAHFVPLDASADDIDRAALKAIDAHFPGFGDRVRAQEILTPRDVEKRYGATSGSLAHGELTLDQILFMRPVPGISRYKTPVSGLFLGGSGCHPGPGVSGGAGSLAAAALLEDR